MKLTQEQVARLLNVHRHTVRAMLRDGRLDNLTIDSLIKAIKEETYTRARKETIQELRYQGWLRKRPWPSKLERAISNPWIQEQEQEQEAYV